ncbi:hypothetical protein [Sphingomonas sp. VNH70]|uniref:hypothetical protein n=1 Tax=Sphingomonas silueang TaxID=3156617 RepID=UPI0032B4B58C
MTGVVAFGIVILLLPVLVVAAVLAAAWREGRSSPYAFSVGRVISNSFAAIGGAPLVFVGVALLLNGLPSLMVGMTTAQITRSPELVAASMSQVGTTYGGIFLLRLLVWPFTQGLLMLLAVEALAGRVPDLRRAAGTALRVWIFAIGLTLLNWIGITIGFFLFILPGLVLFLNWFVALPVLFVERRGVFEAFGRSTELLRGMRWRLLLLLVIALVLWFFAAMVGGVLQATLPDSWMTHAATLVGATVGGMLVPAGIAAVYHEAVTAKEGAGGRDLSDVFA